MKKSFRSSLTAIVFFAATFLLVFTSYDSDAAAIRTVIFMVVACSSVLAIYLPEMNSRNKESRKLDTLLNDAEEFSKEYGDIYVLADKLRTQRKNKQQTV
ncbi:hypothetical protein [Rufibacter sp. LB8]|uniref:hypothetical protein n=1 Tax=Rufibacter sp. LB8 TaxID=2777781 RepID=UPI00178C3B3D|nr:hypothetical protein [Rufibacter sp. LB8]